MWRGPGVAAPFLMLQCCLSALEASVGRQLCRILRCPLSDMALGISSCCRGRLVALRLCHAGRAREISSLRLFPGVFRSGAGCSSSLISTLQRAASVP